MFLKRIYAFVIVALICLGANLIFAQSQSKGWVAAKTLNANLKAVSSLPEIEVFSAPNVIMLKVNSPSEVRIFTILGKLISSQHLEPGIFEYHMESHGIYLIKTDMSSCKIAI